MDPIRYRGGDVNLYGYVHNNPIQNVDPSGLDRYITIFWSGLDSIHVGIAVDVWDRDCKTFRWKVREIATYNFRIRINGSDGKFSICQMLYNTFAGIVCGQGEVEYKCGIDIGNYRTIPSCPASDVFLLDGLNAQVKCPPRYNALTCNCIWWSMVMIDAGMNKPPRIKYSDDVKCDIPGDVLVGLWDDEKETLGEILDRLEGVCLVDRKTGKKIVPKPELDKPIVVIEPPKLKAKIK